MKEYTAEAKAFYKSKRWERTRKQYAASKDGLCERCLAAGIFTPGQIVHHRIHLNSENLNNPDISLSFDNLELLCQDCHNKEHFAEIPQSRYRFDESGNLIITGE